MPAPYDSSTPIAELLGAICPVTRLNDADAQAAIDELLSRKDETDPDPENHFFLYHSHAVQDVYLGRLPATQEALDGWPGTLTA